MKILSRSLAFLLLISYLFTLVSCGLNSDSDPDGNGTDGVAGEGDVVMSYEGFNLTESEFNFIAANIKDSYVYNYRYNYSMEYGSDITEEEVLSVVIDGKTYGELLKEYTIKYAQRMLVVEKLCNDAGITISDQEVLDSIDEYIEELKFAYGGDDLFEVELVRLGFSENAIRRYYKLSHLYNLLYENRYGENGTAPIAKEDIENYFLENYYCFDGAVYSYVDSTNGSYVMFEYSDEETQTYFNENFVKVKSILYRTIDSYGNSLNSEVKSARKLKAEEALKKIQSGDKTFDDFKTDNEAIVSEYVFTKGDIPDLEDAAFNKLNVGERMMVEGEYGYFVIEKVPLSETDLKGTVGEDGKTTGDRRETVKKAMSIAKVRAEAESTFNKLDSGELSVYPATSKDFPYYMTFEPSYVDKSSPSNEKEAELIELLAKADYGKFIKKEFSSSGMYIYRKIEFDGEKIASDIYSTIEEKLAATELVEYMDDYYDAVEMDTEYFESFDIVALPMLEEEFFNGNGG